jgi:hypothetical protein
VGSLTWLPEIFFLFHIRLLVEGVKVMMNVACRILSQQPAPRVLALPAPDADQDEDEEEA